MTGMCDALFSWGGAGIIMCHHVYQAVCVVIVSPITNNSTPPYMAPQLLDPQDKAHNPAAADVWYVVYTCVQTLITHVCVLPCSVHPPQSMLQLQSPPTMHSPRAAGVVLCAMLLGTFPYDHAARRDPCDAQLDIYCQQHLRAWSELPALQAPLEQVRGDGRMMMGR